MTVGRQLAQGIGGRLADAGLAIPQDLHHGRQNGRRPGFAQGEGRSPPNLANGIFKIFNPDRERPVQECFLGVNRENESQQKDQQGRGGLSRGEACMGRTHSRLPRGGRGRTAKERNWTFTWFRR